MGITVQQWRAAIGVFSGKAGMFSRPLTKQRAPSFGVICGISSLLTIMALLVIGGVELNPGPDKFTLEDIMAKLVDIENKLDKKIDCLASKVSDLNDTVVRLNEEVTAADEKCKSLCENLEKQENQIDYLENQCRRNNIVIRGITQAAPETWQDTDHLVADLLCNKMGISLNSVDIDRAYRVGRGENRPIIVKFLSYKKKMEVLRNAYRLRETGIWVNEDYTAKVRQTRHKLRQHQTAARQNGREATLRYQTLIVDGTRYSLQDLESSALPAEQPLDIHQDQGNGNNVYDSRPFTPSTQHVCRCSSNPILCAFLQHPNRSRAAESTADDQAKESSIAEQ